MEVPTPRPAQPASSGVRVARFIAANLAILVLLLALLEGVASLALLGRDLSSTRLPAERRHTRNDPELGWVNRANLAVPNMYGPGIALHTNAQGFRNVRNFAPAVPAGAMRAICSGDSFTLGYGVADKDTWCARLVLIHLPTQRLLGAPDRWRDFLESVARDLGVGWVDVTAATVTP